MGNTRADGAPGCSGSMQSPGNVMPKQCGEVRAAMAQARVLCADWLLRHAQFIRSVTGAGTRVGSGLGTLDVTLSSRQPLPAPQPHTLMPAPHQRRTATGTHCQPLYLPADPCLSAPTPPRIRPPPFPRSTRSQRLPELPPASASPPLSPQLALLVQAPASPCCPDALHGFLAFNAYPSRPSSHPPPALCT